MVENKTSLYAPKSEEKNFENQVVFLASLPLNNIYTKLTNNLGKTQWFALKSLMNDKQIIIKKADKGGSVVIMSHDHYERMVYSQIHDEGTYKRLDSIKDRNIQIALTKLIKKYKDPFIDAEYKCLISSNFKSSQFYGLPC